MKQQDIFKILDFWNYWEKEPNDIFKREKYLEKIDLFKKSGENIVLSWIRRSWKSSILNLEIKKLLEAWVKQKQILFVNLEDPKFFNNLNLDLLDEVWGTYLYYLEPNLDERIYIFLDEVQLIKAWEKWVLKFYEKKNIQFFITWSSSKLLSREFSTALSGRVLQIEVFPLDFKEFLEFKNFWNFDKISLVREENKIKRFFEEYLNFGSFPKVALLDDEKLKKEELNSYFDTIIIKDIAKRYNISNIDEIKKLAYYFLSNDTKFFSVNSLQKMDLWAYDTIKKYLWFLKETYLFFELSKFDYSVKKQLVNLKKIYSIDTWFVNLLWFNFSENIWRNLENLVFVELKRRAKEIYYHKDKKECDFVIFEKNKIVEAIQVSYSLEDNDTKKREIEWLLEAIQIYELDEWLILTYDEEDEIKINSKKIKIIPIYKWLLNN